MRHRYGPCTAEASIEIERTVEVGEGEDAAECTLFYSVVVSGRYSPGRPPPPCSNHDSPAFSDPGDPPEFDFEKVEIEWVKDEEDEEVKEGHPLFAHVLKPEKIEFTSKEQDDLYEQAARSCPDDYDLEPDHDDY